MFLPQKNLAQSQNFMNLGLLVALENAHKVYPGFLTLDHMGTPLKIKISKIGLCHVLSWPKLGLEPTFLNPGKR